MFFKYVWLFMLVASVVIFIVAFILIIIWNIPSLIDDISGKKAKRYIKTIHRLNSTTSIFNKLDTDDIYLGISSDIILQKDLGSINLSSSSTDSNNESIEVDSCLEDSDDCGTSFLLERYEDYDSTCFLSEKEENSYSDCNEKVDTLNILILEEQSSLE